MSDNDGKVKKSNEIKSAQDAKGTHHDAEKDGVHLEKEDYRTQNGQGNHKTSYSIKEGAHSLKTNNDYVYSPAVGTVQSPQIASKIRAAMDEAMKNGVISTEEAAAFKKVAGDFDTLGKNGLTNQETQNVIKDLDDAFKIAHQQNTAAKPTTKKGSGPHR